MNKQRRAEITKCVEELEDIKARLDSARDEEEDSLFNLPESIQCSEKGDTMQENVDDLDSVIGLLDDAIDSINEVLER